MVKSSHFDRVARLYDVLTRILMMGTYGRVQKKILGMKPNAQNSVLDICTGTGYLIEKLNAKNIIGIDLSKGMLEVNKKKHKNKKNLQLIRGDAFNLPFRSSSFDTIYWTFGSHEFMNIKPILKEAHRILKNRGSLIIFDIFDPSFLPARLYVNGVIKYIAELGRMKVYTEKGWREILKEAGFRDENVLTEVMYTSSILVKADKQ